MPALILALMTFGKVLSPQYFIWTLPAWALVAAHDRVLAVLGGLTLLLTGIEFPRLYWDILGMHHGPLALLIARNVMLVAAFGFAVWRLWRLPEGTSAGMATKPPAAPRVSPPSMLR